MKVLVPHGTTPTGFGLGQTDDELLLTSYCCGASLKEMDKDWIEECATCGVCGARVAYPNSVANYGVFWNDLESDLKRWDESRDYLMREWLSGWFGFEKEDMEVVFGENSS